MNEGKLTVGTLVTIFLLTIICLGLLVFSSKYTHSGENRVSLLHLVTIKTVFPNHSVKICLCPVTFTSVFFYSFHVF